MAKRLQLRRGTSIEHQSFTGALGEVTIDTTEDVLVVHDAVTLGGIKSTRADKSAYTIPTVSDFTIVPSTYTTVVVKDIDRGGTFIWSNTGTANGGTIFAGTTGYWIRQYSGAINVKWFGAVGDGITDDYSSINSCIAYAKTFDSANILFKNGVYIISNTIVLNNSSITIEGEGVVKDNFSVTGANFTLAQGTVLRASTSNKIALIATLATDTKKMTGGGFKNIAFDGNGIATSCLSLENTDRNMIEGCSFEGATSYQVKVMAINRAMPNTSATDSQNNNFSNNIIKASGTSVGLYLGSDVEQIGNASVNTFVNTYIRHSNGAGIYLQNADSNTFIATRITRIISDTGKAIVFGEGSGTATDNQYARTNMFYNLHSSQSPIEALGATTNFPSIDNAIYGFNLDGGSAIQDITVGTNATLSVITARQQNIVSQNMVAVANTAWQNFHASPFTAGTALSKFKELGFFPINGYANGGNIAKYYNSITNSEYKIILGATGMQHIVPTNIVNPIFELSGWNISGKIVTLQGNQVLSARKTGWGVPTGTSTKTTFDTATVTVAQLAERVKALLADLTLHGLIGA